MKWTRIKAIKLPAMLSFFAVLLLSAALYATTPVIAKVSVSSFVQGSVVIVMGSHLRDTDLSGLELSQTQSNFEGASLASDGWAEVVDYGNTGALTLDRTVFLTGAQSFCTRLFRCATEGSGYRCGAFIRDYPRAYNNPMQNVYVRYYVRYAKGFQWPNNYLKQFYFHGQTSGFCFQPMVPTQGFGYASAQPNVSYYRFSKPMAEERWYCIEGRFNADGSGEMWLDGKSIGTGGPGPNPGGWYYFEIGTPNASTFATNPDSKIWFDGFNMSETRRINPEAMVYLANGPNFATATKVSQELLYLSDTDLRFKVDVTGLGTGPLYLFVVNNRNENSAAFLPTTGIHYSTSSAAPGVGAAGKMWARNGVMFFRPSQDGEYSVSAYNLAGQLAWKAQGKGLANETVRLDGSVETRGVVMAVLEQAGMREYFQIPLVN